MKEDTARKNEKTRALVFIDITMEEGMERL
jgi:hypothetical protein